MRISRSSPGQGGIPGLPALAQRSFNLLARANVTHLSHGYGARRVNGHILRRVSSHDNGNAQLTIHAAEHEEKLLERVWVELGSRLIKQE